MPISEPAAEMPAYSAQMVPKLVSSSAMTAALRLKRGRRDGYRGDKPPVPRRPMRTAMKWNWISSSRQRNHHNKR
ncbi:MAG: hypothetical protein IPG43_19340 [Proteobacteria bacterium]|nr:hypothetical protein [Pseudomonadota bacterium]